MKHTSIDIVQLQRNVAISRCEKAYQQLFLHYYKPLIRFAITIAGTREAAEEIYSNVLLKIWNLGNGLNNIDNLTVYLYINVKNASLNYLSKSHVKATPEKKPVGLAFTAMHWPGALIMVYYPKQLIMPLCKKHGKH